jgi:hypothetical protein
MTSQHWEYTYLPQWGSMVGYRISYRFGRPRAGWQRRPPRSCMAQNTIDESAAVLDKLVAPANLRLLTGSRDGQSTGSRNSDAISLNAVGKLRLRDGTGANPDSWSHDPGVDGPPQNPINKLPWLPAVGDRAAAKTGSGFPRHNGCATSCPTLPPLAGEIHSTGSR